MPLAGVGLSGATVPINPTSRQRASDQTDCKGDFGGSCSAPISFGGQRSIQLSYGCERADHIERPAPSQRRPQVFGSLNWINAGSPKAEVTGSNPVGCARKFRGSGWPEGLGLCAECVPSSCAARPSRQNVRMPTVLQSGLPGDEHDPRRALSPTPVRIGCRPRSSVDSGIRGWQAASSGAPWRSPPACCDGWPRPSTRCRRRCRDRPRCATPTGPR